MDKIITLYTAVLSMDMNTLAEPNVLLPLYGMLFFILLLECGILPAAFLPGDSLLFLTGILISVDIFHFGVLNFILIAGAAIGTWLGHIQGRLLGNTKIVRSWMAHLPPKYHQRAYTLFHKYGLLALFVARFIPFVRTIMPIIAGLSGLRGKYFHIYNWLSAALWIFLIVTAGYLFGLSPIFSAYKEQFLLFFMLIPIILLVMGLIASIWVVIQRQLKKKSRKRAKKR